MRPLLLWLFACALAASACSGGGSSGVPSVAIASRSAPASSPRPGRVATEGARPAGLPVTAEPVLLDLQFGAPEAAAGADQTSVVRFFSLRCGAGLLTLGTTAGTVCAELPCDRSLPPDVVHWFQGKPLRVRAAIGQPRKLHLESSEAGTVEFTVGDVWIAK